MEFELLSLSSIRYNVEPMTYLAVPQLSVPPGEAGVVALQLTDPDPAVVGGGGEGEAALVELVVSSPGDLHGAASLSDLATGPLPLAVRGLMDPPCITHSQETDIPTITRIRTTMYFPECTCTIPRNHQLGRRE